MESVSRNRIENIKQKDDETLVVTLKNDVTLTIHFGNLDQYKESESFFLSGKSRKRGSEEITPAVTKPPEPKSKKKRKGQSEHISSGGKTTHRSEITNFVSQYKELSVDSDWKDYEDQSEQKKIIPIIEAYIKQFPLTLERGMEDNDDQTRQILERDWLHLHTKVLNLFQIDPLVLIPEQKPYISAEPVYTTLSDKLLPDAVLGYALKDGSEAQQQFAIDNSIAYHWQKKDSPDITYLPLVIVERKRSTRYTSKESDTPLRLIKDRKEGREDAKVTSYFTLQWLQKLFPGFKKVTAIGVCLWGPWLDVYQFSKMDEKYQLYSLFTGDLSFNAHLKPEQLKTLFKEVKEKINKTINPEEVAKRAKELTKAVRYCRKVLQDVITEMETNYAEQLSAEMIQTRVNAITSSYARLNIYQRAFITFGLTTLRDYLLDTDSLQHLLQHSTPFKLLIQHMHDILEQQDDNNKSKSISSRSSMIINEQKLKSIDGPQHLDFMVAIGGLITVARSHDCSDTILAAIRERSRQMFG